MASILTRETFIKYTALLIAIFCLIFSEYLVWKFLQLDPYNTKVMIALLMTASTMFLGTLAIFSTIQTNGKYKNL